MTHFSLIMKTPFGVKAVRSARKVICLLAGEWEYSEQASREIELCFSEAVHNAMEHGSSGDEYASVSCVISNEEFKIEIEDPGAGEGNIQELKDAFNDNSQSLPDQNNERGRGIFLIRNLMDFSQMECMENGGVRITMIKKKS